MAKSEGSDKVQVSSKGALGVALSHLKGFHSPKVRVEQHMTEPEIGATVLWHAHMKEDIGKVSIDMGCGTGLLGIGLLLLGAKNVHFVESDSSALETARENLKKVKSEYCVDGEAFFHLQDIRDFSKSAGLVVQNPPFGLKVRHADKMFLQKAMEIGKVAYSFHKTESKQFIAAFSSKNNFMVTDVWDFEWPLKATQQFHSRRIKRIKVSCFRLEKKGIDSD